MAIVSSVQDVMDDAVAILAKQIRLLRCNTDRANSPPLSKDEATKLQKYIKCLVELSKEEREIEKDMKLTDLTDEELLQIARETIGKLGSE